MSGVSLADILAAREERVGLQRELIMRHGVPVICFTMNIAGPRKTSPLILRAFNEGVCALDLALSGWDVPKRIIHQKDTGYEAFYSVNRKESDIKELCVQLEGSMPLGRLFDMDVIGVSGEKLSRGDMRKCIICDMPAMLCARSRAHSVPELEKATRRIITDHFRAVDRARIGALAHNSLLKEVYTTPKPGLVDLQNSGSHRDMDVHSFEASAAALLPYFERCFTIGIETADRSFDEAFCELRYAGIEAEGAMYRATDGVNTHKGAIYSMGIIAGSVGRLWRAERPFATTDEILECAGALSHNAAVQDLRTSDGSTAGSRLYLLRGITGIRGEAMAGFPSVKSIALPCLRSLAAGKEDITEAGAVVLLHLIRSVDDTSLYKRGGEDGVKYARSYAARLIEGGKIPKREELVAMDAEFIKRGLSPGGCADLLAITYFLYALSEQP